MELTFKFTGSTYAELQSAIEKELRSRGKEALAKRNGLARTQKQKRGYDERANAFFDAADFVKSIKFEET